MVSIKWQHWQHVPLLQILVLRRANLFCRMSRAICFPSLLDCLNERTLSRVDHDYIYSWHRCYICGIQLSIAASDNEECPRMTTTRLADELPRTPVTQVSDRAGIDDIDIRSITKITLHKTRSTHLFANSLAIGLIDFTAQRGNSVCV